MRLEAGRPVRSSDGVLRELADIVVDPARRRVTHLVVEPHGEHNLARLVPVEQIAPADDSEVVSLRATAEEIDRFEHVQSYTESPVAGAMADDPDWTVGVEDAFAIPRNPGASFGDDADDYRLDVGATYDRIPKGDIEVRSKSTVLSADDHLVGHVDGFLVDGDGQITDVLVDHGHLWKRHQVTVPISAVAFMENDSIKLELPKKDLGL